MGPKANCSRTFNSRRFTAQNRRNFGPRPQYRGRPLTRNSFGKYEKHHKIFLYSFTKGKKNKKQELLKKLNEFSSYVHLNDFYKERQEAEGELRRLNEDFLMEEAMIFIFFSLC